MSEMTATGVRAPRVVPRRKYKWRPIIEGYLFCAPFLIGVIAFWAAPMLYSIALAFTQDVYGGKLARQTRINYFETPAGDGYPSDRGDTKSNLRRGITGELDLKADW